VTTPSGIYPLSHEARLSRLLAAYVVTGLLFMLLPGTFLGVWNLISISGEHSLSTLSAAWIQAHGHAQVFGWIGTFIIGIGYYSLSKMGAIPAFALRRGWMSWALWISGVSLRWAVNISLWNWRILLPVSALAELAGFLIFFATVSRHESTGRRSEARMPAWMLLVIGSTVGFLCVLLFNLGTCLWLGIAANAPEFPHWLDQRFLVLATWGVPVLAIWGFNARWLPAFMGLKPASERGLRAALLICITGVIAALSGHFAVAAALLTIAAANAAAWLNIFDRSAAPPNLQGVHRSFPALIRLCYVWLAIAAVLTMWAAIADRNGGIWGASRHALTVGFLAGMIFAIGPRILPAFCGGRKLFSPLLMLASCSLLNLGCLLRVSSEIPAYEGLLHGAWSVLPVSAVVEMTAVTLFALNLALTIGHAAVPLNDTTLYKISFATEHK
jgi:uncharacterized protein involved in response to NO